MRPERRAKPNGKIFNENSLREDETRGFYNASGELFLCQRDTIDSHSRARVFVLAQIDPGL